VPDGVLFGSSIAHKTLRRMLVEDQKLDAVVSLPSGAFRPYAGVSTAILLFTKTNSGGTDYVCSMTSKPTARASTTSGTRLVPDDRFGPIPAAALTAEEHAKNNLPTSWLAGRRAMHRARPPRTARVSVSKVRNRGTGLRPLLDRYKQVVHQKSSTAPRRDPRRSGAAGAGIQQGVAALGEMLE